MADLFADVRCPVCGNPVTRYGCVEHEQAGSYCRAPRKVTFEIPEGTRPSRCSSCGAQIFFVKHGGTGRSMPLNPSGTSHFATCSTPERFRRPR